MKSRGIEKYGQEKKIKDRGKEKRSNGRKEMETRFFYKNISQ